MFWNPEVLDAEGRKLIFSGFRERPVPVYKEVAHNKRC